MPPLPGDPLRKVTLNLYEADCVAAEEWYGRGWSEKLREVWHNNMQLVTLRARAMKTLGDLDDE